MNNDTVVLNASRSGPRYASYAGVRLNSAYDPVREAVRFLDGQPAVSSPGLFLILGDTLPYLRSALHERFPEADVVSIYFHRDFPAVIGRADEAPPSPDYWTPAGSSPLRDYLLHRLPSPEIGGVAVLQWPPAVRAFPELAQEALRIVEQVVREGAAEWVTSTAFSRAWNHNLLANFLSIDRWHLLPPHHAPVVVAASGPSLAQALPVIRDNRRRIALIALPSSLDALASADLRPDLLVTVDAGYWAQLHLRALDEWPSTPVALPLIASRGSWRRRNLPVILSAGSFVERELFRRAGLAPSEILATATVSASALELAARWTDGPLLVAGLDLCYDGLEEHVRPHAFDTHFEAAATRTKPHLAIVAERLIEQGLKRSGGSPAVTPALKTYAGWFRDWSGAARVYRLFPSRVSLQGFTPVNDFTAFLEDYRDDSAAPAAVPAPTPALQARKRTVSDLLDSWMRALEAAARCANSGRDASVPPGTGALLSSLAPRSFLRYRQALKAGVDGPASSRAELIDNAVSEVAEMKRRFLP